ncbi:MAG: response regulator transcription factor [Verrucomicrobiales bacterium]|nr:response regulator transcription factor [Verrucomicrobiales bacterium]MCP5526301.1 response regulator transcription factor [Verrucomicrobiales bacterium]
MNEARTLLIADDSAAMRHAIARCCAGPNDTVVEAATGAEAVELHARCQPDWTVMDIRMPIMDGLSATREIRRQFPEARIVIVTQHDLPGLRRAACAEGVDAFFLKDDLTRLEAILGERDAPALFAANQNPAPAP